MKLILGEKIGMTQVFNSEGKAEAATVVRTEPMVVTHVKTVEKDGYGAIQVGTKEKKEKNLKKPQKGHLKDLGNFGWLREFRVSEDKIANYKPGDKIEISTFSEGDKITISAISKGKGFQGVVKRHGFGGGRRSHGQKHSEREAGSIGGGGRAGGRVVKGMRMAGRMGSDRVTFRNLRIIGVNQEENYVLVSGAIPGRRGTKVEIVGQ